MKSASSMNFMWLILCFLLLICSSTDFELLKKIADLSSPFHAFCKEVTPQSPWMPYYNAILCGEKLELTDSHPFRTTGIYHLMVVSGMHLVFCEYWICRVWPKKSSPPKCIVFIGLTIYASMSLWNPPVLRALLHWVLRNINRHLKLGYLPHETSFTVGLLGLCLFPELAYSISYQLSWLASLALHLNLKHKVSSYIWVYVVLFPVLSSWGTNHPLGIGVSFVLTPILGIIMLPLALLSCVSTNLSELTDLLWQGLLSLLNYLSQSLSLELLTSTYSFHSSQYVWVYIGFIQLILALKRRWRRIL